MNRQEFLKTIALFTGGLTVVSCNPMLIDDMLAPGESPEDLSISEAEKWFNEEYLPNTSKFRISNNGKSYKRKASWKRAQKPKNNENKEFGWVWTPLDYDDDARPGIIVYNEETSYKKDLGKYYLQPIIEGIVVIKVNNETKAFLAQLAYDPFELESNNFQLDKETFTGTLIRSDWNDNVIDGTTFVNGQIIQGFTNPNNASSNSIVGEENARVSNCIHLTIDYTTWYIDEDDVFTLVGHTSWAVVCDESGNGGWGGGGGVYVYDSGGTSTGGGYTGGAYYNPLLGSGNGAWVMPSNMYYNFNIYTAIATPGPDRTALNENLENTLWGIGLATNISSWSIDKAVALAHSAGLVMKQYFPMAVVAGRYIGVAGLAMSGYTMWVGLSDGFTFNEDGWNIALTALSGTSVALSWVFVAANPWIAVTVGAVSLTIAIVQEVNND